MKAAALPAAMPARAVWDNSWCGEAVCDGEGVGATVGTIGGLPADTAAAAAMGTTDVPDELTYLACETEKFECS